MVIKVSGESPFQILSTTFSIGPSTSGYDLYFSADGVNYTQLFTVGANVNRQVTQVAAGSYYKLVGNTGNVVVNWYGNCVVDNGGGGGGTQYTAGDGIQIDGTSISVKAGEGLGFSGGTLILSGGTSVTYLNEGIEVDFDGGYVAGDIEAFFNSLNAGVTPGSEYAMPAIPIYTASGGIFRLCKITSLTKDAQSAYVIFEVENPDFNTGAGSIFNEYGADIYNDGNELVWEASPRKCLGTPGANKIDLTDEGMPAQGGLRPDVIWMLMLQDAGEPNNFDFSIKCETLEDGVMHYGAVKTWDLENRGLIDYSGITGYTEFMNIGAEVAGMDWEARIVHIYGIEEEPTQQEMETFEGNYGVYTYNEAEDWYEIYFYEVLKWEPAVGGKTPIILEEQYGDPDWLAIYNAVAQSAVTMGVEEFAKNYDIYIKKLDDQENPYALYQAVGYAMQEGQDWDEDLQEDVQTTWLTFYTFENGGYTYWLLSTGPRGLGAITGFYPDSVAHPKSSWINIDTSGNVIDYNIEKVDEGLAQYNDNGTDYAFSMYLICTPGDAERYRGNLQNFYKSYSGVSGDYFFRFVIDIEGTEYEAEYYWDQANQQIVKIVFQPYKTYLQSILNS